MSRNQDKPDTNPSLTDRAAHGFAWMLSYTVISRVVNTLAVIVLGRILLEDEWGLIGLCIAVRTFTDLVQRAGIQQVLIQRCRHFSRWATPGLWMVMALGLGSTVVMTAASPVIAAIYGKRELILLICVLSAVPPIAALGVVPRASLVGGLRFRAVAMTDLSASVSLGVLRVGLCILAAQQGRPGLGALAFIIPEPIVEAGRTCAYWLLARPRVRWRLRWRRWRYLIGDSAWLFGGTTAVKLVEQVDYLIIGLFHATDVVGVYFFAYSLSIQTLRVFAAQLEVVLLPALSHLQTEMHRQISAFKRAARLLAIAVVPLCFLQAALFEPTFRVIFPSGHMHGAIAPGQVLSIGMSMWVLYGPTASLIKAQGRFRTFMIMSIAYAAFFILSITIAAANGGAVAVAAAVGLCMAVYGPIQMYVGISIGGGTWMDVMKIFLPPIVLGLIAAATGAWAARLLPEMFGRDLARIAVILLVGGGLYAAFVRWLLPDVWFELVGRLRRLVPIGRRS